MVIIVSLFNLFRIAIWNRDVVMSLISVGIWLCALALNIRRTYRNSSLFALSSHVLFPRVKRPDNGERLHMGSNLGS